MRSCADSTRSTAKPPVTNLHGCTREPPRTLIEHGSNGNGPQSLLAHYPAAAPDTNDSRGGDLPIDYTICIRRNNSLACASARMPAPQRGCLRALRGLIPRWEPTLRGHEGCQCAPRRKGRHPPSPTTPTLSPLPSEPWPRASPRARKPDRGPPYTVNS